MTLVVKNPPANAGDIRDTVSIPGSRRSPGEGAHSSVLAWKIPWIEKPGGLADHGVAESDMTERLTMHDNKLLKEGINAK